MLITITAMGGKDPLYNQRVYVADIKRNGNRRRVVMTQGLAQAIQRRVKSGAARRLWAAHDFTTGKIGRQAQYQV